ncbi:VCBS repeat-containing protein [Psychroflexus salis]|uniref:ASPIC/UnbV domain-containing protein n=1 Tax=Psychroflexus salis TaxID=1526574 RepID=A0A916ZP61_9FLAO|nr:VCBS repeat-containing protein [Psychroflexus salis]GGE07290.1 hypothetical protein GCM10010831_06020 [Psychroflexus salis]
MRFINTTFAFLILIGCTPDAIKKEKPYFLLNELQTEQTGIDFQNLVFEDEEHSIINYIYYYNGAGVATGDINGDGLPDLFFVANSGENKLYVNEGNFKFKDVSEQAQITGNSSWQTGVSMVDINQDGLLDIYVCAVSGLLDFKGHNELYINNGDGTFTESAKAYGLAIEAYSTQAYFFDYDKDGDLDVYIVNHAVHTNLSHGKASLREKRVDFVGDMLLRNDDGYFNDVSEEANIYGGINGYGLSATLADFNNDGWDDIYVCNDFHEDDYYYINNQDGTFTESLNESFSTISRFSMGSDAADINGDGFQDLISLDMLPEEEYLLKSTEGDDAMFNMQAHLKKMGYKDQYSRNMLQINRNGEFFTEEALLQEIADTDWSWAALFADFNNDMHQDLFISNGIYRRPNSLDFKKYVSSAFRGKSEAEGLKWLYNSIDKMPSGNVANKIYKGNSVNFLDKTGNWISNQPKLSNGAVYVDLDLDGDLDLVTNNFNETASVYENTSTESGNYLDLKLNYLSSNRNAIGAKAMVYSQEKTQLKQLFTARGFLSSVEAKLHFGLGNTTADSLQIIWPNNERQVVLNPELNTTLEIDYKSTGEMYASTDEKRDTNLIFKETNAIAYTHQEDDYNDFAEEKLIPYKVSTLGPALAIGDITANGFVDVLIGNAAGKPAELYLNSGTKFTKSNQYVFTEDSHFEDNAAVFIDIDQDGDLDLYLASGANKNARYLADRLYINHQGVFDKTENLIPENSAITSSLIAYDYDQDGDDDLFVGNYATQGNFGETPISYILINHGDGSFSKDPNFKLQSRVTDAKWIDLNSDGIKDLVVTTEWDRPYLFLNNQGQLTAVEIPEQLNGLWQTLAFFDVDTDGQKDIVLGNYGLNTKFNLNFDDSLLMYHSDFDNNGVEETVLAYNHNGSYYPLNTKDELAGQMNVISKRFKDHNSMAGQLVEDVLTKEAIQKAKVYRVDVLASGYLKNNNGTFSSFIPLDKEFQLAPINTISEIKLNSTNQLLFGGNSYKMNTYHGAYNSLKGLLLKNDKEFDLLSEFGLKPLHEQVKHLQVIPMKNENILLILSNNQALKTYSFK